MEREEKYNGSNEIVAIIDAWSQYTKLIQNHVEDLWVRGEIIDANTPLEKLKTYKAIIISWWPQSTTDENAVTIDPAILDSKIPILGICYGMQLLNLLSGWKIETLATREDGQDTITQTNNSILRDGLEQEEKFLLTHGDTVTDLAPWFEQIAKSSHNLTAAIQDTTKNLYWVQFHPEVDLSIKGDILLSNFLYKIANCEWWYEKASLLKQITNQMENDPLVQEVLSWKKKFLVLASGGIDSTVCAALLTKVVGKENIILLHIDNGFMREQEAEQTVMTLEKMWFDIGFIQWTDIFLNSTTQINNQETKKLGETIDPEEKRKIIGDTFMKAALSHLESEWLSLENMIIVQWTLRTDLEESWSKTVSKQTDTIKTHHNDTQWVRDLRDAGSIYEPLKELEKSQVRKLSEEFGMPEEITKKQPFPWPWLAIRIICGNQSLYDENMAQIDKDLEIFFADSQLQGSILPIKTVWVQGDGRSYKYGVVLSGPEDRKSILHYASEIPNHKQFHQINRIVYAFWDPIQESLKDITPTTLGEDTAGLVRKADHIVNTLLQKHKLDKSTAISQMPVILTPVSFGKPGGRSIVLRPFITNTFKTGRAAIPGEDIPVAVLEEIVKEVQLIPGIARVMLDLTGKPPGTTERE
jgi:GMP synthase (glutamine-hydrolysing)